MFKKILVPLDGSAPAEKALDLSVDMAKCYGGEIIVLQVQEDAMDVGEAAVARATALATGSEAQAMDIVRHRAEAYLREAIQTRAIATGLPIDMAVVSGKPADAILAFAEENKCELIVMATHGRTGLRRWAFGSVTEDVLHKAKCPVLVIRPPDYNLN